MSGELFFCFFLSSVFLRLPDLHGITVVNIFSLVAASAVVVVGRGCNGTAKQMSV